MEARVSRIAVNVGGGKLGRSVQKRAELFANAVRKITGRSQGQETGRASFAVGNYHKLQLLQHQEIGSRQ